MKSISWSEFRARLIDENGLTLSSVDQFSQEVGATSPSDWLRVPNWEGLDDAELLKLFKSVPNSELIVIGEACYAHNHDPMLLDKSYSLEQFASEYFKEFGESLFNGDVFIFSFAANYVGIFHHEGLCYEGQLN